MSRIHIDITMEEELVKELAKISEGQMRNRSNTIEWLVMQEVERRKNEQ